MAQDQPWPGHHLFYRAARPSLNSNTHLWAGLSHWTWPWVGLSQHPG